MTRIDLREATAAEVDRLWPVVKTAHLFPDPEAFLSARSENPWRVRVDARDRAVVLERWRPHLEIMAIRGLWAPVRDVPGIVEGLRTVARGVGLSVILSPLVSEQAASPYRRAGLAPYAPIIALRIDARRAAAVRAELPDDVRLSSAIASDLGAVEAVDRGCFEPFWAYDTDRIRSALSSGHVTVARSREGIIGYTLCTVERGSGTLGRLAVVPQARGRGVGAALLAQGLRHMAQSGASTISLCTQEENAASRSLYTHVGLREIPGRLLLLAGDV